MTSDRLDIFGVSALPGYRLKPIECLLLRSEAVYGATFPGTE
jgi:hypothetical protein